MTVTLKFIGFANGEPAPISGHYLVKYDPTIDKEQRILLETTTDRSKAKKFANPGEAFSEWKRVSPNVPIRYDGKPNRPLTAYTVEIEELR